MNRERCSVGIRLAVLLSATLAVSVLRGEVISYTANLSGGAEFDPNTSPGTGFAQVDYDGTAHTMRVRVTFADLLGLTTAAHIHSPTLEPGSGTAGVATQTPTFLDFPLGVTSGSYDHVFDLTLTSSYNAPFVAANGGTAAGAEAFLASSLADTTAYLNIHTGRFPTGEIRGFLQSVPEPSGLAMASLAAVGLVALGWRRGVK